LSATGTANGDRRFTYISDPKEKSVGKRAVKAVEDCFLTVTVWEALEDNGMTGQQVRLWRLLMLG
jgi:hypothetical protein